MAAARETCRALNTRKYPPVDASGMTVAPLDAGEDLKACIGADVMEERLATDSATILPHPDPGGNSEHGLEIAIHETR